MTKNKATEILQEIILKHMECGSSCCPNDKTLYMTILTEIEDKLGMFPPYNPPADYKGDGLLSFCGWEQKEVKLYNFTLTDKHDLPMNEIWQNATEIAQERQELFTRLVLVESSLSLKEKGIIYKFEAYGEGCDTDQCHI